MAGPTGLEPATSGVTGLRSNQLSYDPARCSDDRTAGHASGESGGRYRTRTDDVLRVKQVLYQLS
jgi:hypothetical protein